MHILVVEDDASLAEGLRTALSRAGHGVDVCRDGELAEATLRLERYALVVLDLGLPRRSGSEVLQAMRRRGDKTPVLILTARDTAKDRVAGLDGGADDYLVKPFDLGEFLARIRALLRRGEGRADPILRVGDIELDPAAKSVRKAGMPAALSRREFGVLQLLLSNRGRVLSRAQLEEGLYGWAEDGPESNVVEVHIHHLRRKLGPDLIRTVRGVGYLVDRPAS